MWVSTGYTPPAVPAVNVVSSLPRRSTRSAVLIVAGGLGRPSDGAEQPGAVLAVAEPFLPDDAVAEIEGGLQALDATGGCEQVNRLVVSSLPVASVLTVGPGQAPRRVARRADPPGSRCGGAGTGRCRIGDHHAGRAAR